MDSLLMAPHQVELIFQRKATMEQISTPWGNITLVHVLLFCCFSQIFFLGATFLVRSFHYDVLTFKDKLYQEQCKNNAVLAQLCKKMDNQNHELWLRLYKLNAQPEGEKTFKSTMTEEHQKLLLETKTPDIPVSESSTTETPVTEIQAKKEKKKMEKFDFENMETNPMKLIWRVGIFKTMVKMLAIMMTGLLIYVMGKSLAKDYIKEMQKKVEE